MVAYEVNEKMGQNETCLAGGLDGIPGPAMPGCARRGETPGLVVVRHRQFDDWWLKAEAAIKLHQVHHDKHLNGFKPIANPKETASECFKDQSARTTLQASSRSAKSCCSRSAKAAASPCARIPARHRR